MPAWIQIILAIIPLAAKLIDKFVPSHVTKKREFKSKKKAMDFCGKTIEQIRHVSVHRGWIKEEKQ